MVQLPTQSPDLATDLRPGILASQMPQQFVADFPSELPVPRAGRGTTSSRVRTRSRAIREVVVVEATGRLADVVEDLDRAIQLALADGPRGVVCDLSGVPEGAEPIAVEVLATAGRHARDWPGIPVAVACPDQRVREALAVHPLGRHLILTASLFSAVTAVLATPTLTVESRRLAPHPTAPRASRNFVTRTLLDWRLGRVIPFATLVVSELVSSSSMNAGTDIDVSVVWNLGALRLTVRDHGPGMPRQPHSDLDLHGRGLTVVAGLTRAFGVLPGADGGKVVWAVLEAPRPRPSVRRVRPARVAASGESPVFTDGRGVTSLPFCATSAKRVPLDPGLPTHDAGPTLVR
jgi:hypothetical protein